MLPFALVSAFAGLVSAVPSSYGACKAQPVGHGPRAQHDTVEDFYALHALSSMSSSAHTPDGYSQVFQGQQGCVSAPQYLDSFTMSSYDTISCASMCDTKKGCEGFNMYIERDPSVVPQARKCPNPPSITNYICTLWGVPVCASQVKDKGHWEFGFHVVITGSNGYTKRGPKPKTTPVSSAKSSLSSQHSSTMSKMVSSSLSKLSTLNPSTLKSTTSSSVRSTTLTWTSSISSSASLFKPSSSKSTTPSSSKSTTPSSSKSLTPSSSKSTMPSLISTTSSSLLSSVSLTALSTTSESIPSSSIIIPSSSISFSQSLSTILSVPSSSSAPISSSSLTISTSLFALPSSITLDSSSTIASSTESFTSSSIVSTEPSQSTSTADISSSTSVIGSTSSIVLDLTVTSTGAGSPSPTSHSCPVSNGVCVSEPNGNYVIACGINYSGEVTGAGLLDDLDGCIAACDEYGNCVAANYDPQTGSCQFTGRVEGEATYPLLEAFMKVDQCPGSSSSTTLSSPSTVESSTNSASESSTPFGSASSTSMSSAVSTMSTNTVSTASESSTNGGSSTDTISASSSSMPTAASPSTPSSAACVATPIPLSPTSNPLTCPASDGSCVSTTGGNWLVTCYIDYYDNDAGNVLVNSLNECIVACDDSPGCVAVSWVPGQPGYCYLKSAAPVEDQTANLGVWGAKKVDTCPCLSSPTSCSISVSVSTSIDVTSTPATTSSSSGPESSAASTSTTSSAALSSPITSPIGCGFIPDAGFEDDGTAPTDWALQSTDTGPNQPPNYFLNNDPNDPLYGAQSGFQRAYPGGMSTFGTQITEVTAGTIYIVSFFPKAAGAPGTLNVLVDNVVVATYTGIDEDAYENVAIEFTATGPTAIISLQTVCALLSDGACDQSFDEFSIAPIDGICGSQTGSVSTTASESVSTAASPSTADSIAAASSTASSSSSNTPSAAPSSTPTPTPTPASSTVLVCTGSGQMPVINGGFEAGNPPWTNTDGGSFFTGSEQDLGVPPHSGVNCADLGLDNGDSVFTVWETINTCPGVPYSFSAWARRADDQSSGCQITFSADGVDFVQTTLSDPDGEWHETTFLGVVFAGSTGTLAMTMSCAAGSQVEFPPDIFVDDIGLTLAEGG